MEAESLKSIREYLSNHDNSKNLVQFSEIPQICKEEPCILGIDEAGRGPVLGPMVYGIAFCPASKSEILKELGCADSKSLTEEKREIIFGKMLTEESTMAAVGWAIEVISPNSICNSMLRRAKHSLNEVSMDSAIGLVNKAIEKGVNISEVYVDTVGPPEKYEAKLKIIFPDFKITVAKKADSTYPIVSAASIAAKVSRDHSLKLWKFREGLTLSQENFGSGYPGDPVTKSFIRDQIDPVFGYPRLVRFSWSTAKLMLDDKAYVCEFDNLDEDETAAKKKKLNGAGSKKISSFFSASQDVDSPKFKRHTYFKERFLTHTEDL